MVIVVGLPSLRNDRVSYNHNVRSSSVADLVGFEFEGGDAGARLQGVRDARNSFLASLLNSRLLSPELLDCTVFAMLVAPLLLRSLDSRFMVGGAPHILKSHYVHDPPLKTHKTQPAHTLGSKL